MSERTAVQKLRHLAKLLGVGSFDIPGQLNEAADEIERLRTALQFFADPESWKLNGPCDPNSGNFRGIQVADAALGAQS